MDKMTLNDLSLDRVVGTKFQFAKGKKSVYKVIDWAKDTKEEWVTYLSGRQGVATVTTLLVIVKNEKDDYQVFNLDKCGDREIVIIKY